MPVLVTGKIKHANSKNAVADTTDIDHGSRRLSDYLPVGVTQEQRDALEAAGVTIPTQLYVIVDKADYMPEGLNQAQLDALAAAGLLPGGGDG